MSIRGKLMKSYATRKAKHATADRYAQVRAARRAEVDERARTVRANAGLYGAALSEAFDRRTPATFSHLYSSRDDALSVFQDGEGHVVAVGTARLV